MGERPAQMMKPAGEAWPVVFRGNPRTGEVLADSIYEDIPKRLPKQRGMRSGQQEGCRRRWTRRHRGTEGSPSLHKPGPHPSQPQQPQQPRGVAARQGCSASPLSNWVAVPRFQICIQFPGRVRETESPLHSCLPLPGRVQSARSPERRALALCSPAQRCTRLLPPPHPGLTAFLPPGCGGR